MYKKVSNFKLLMGIWRNHNNLIDYISEIKKEQGESFHFSFGTMNGVFINEPDVAKAILIEKWALFPKSKRYSVLSPLIGNSILASNGEVWKERRVLAQPIFQAKAISNYKEIIEKEIQTSLSGLIPGQKFDIYSHVAQFTFRVISKIMFSSDIDEVFEEFHHVITRIQNECTKVALYPFPVMDKLPLPTNITFKKLSRRIHRIVDSIIEKRLLNQRGQYNDLLSRYLLMLKNENIKFPMTELRNELVTMLIAGNETTALSLTWALFEMSKPQHQVIQSDLTSELKNLELPAGEENSFLYLKQIPLLGQIINETLRMYPAVWLFSRDAISDFEYNDIKIKKGSLVLISPYFLHRNVAHWDNPDQFNPSRFKQSINEDAFIPFAKGPRSCIGMSLAQFEIYLYLFHFFKHFRIEGGEELNSVRPKPLVNLYPNQPIHAYPGLL